MTPSADDLQVTVLTPAGRGAVAVVGVWGSDATEAVDKIFFAVAGRPLRQFPLGRIVFGRWGGPQGEELVVCRRATDAVEIHCHGGTASVAAIVDSLVAAGCRATEPDQWLLRNDGDHTIVEAHLALARARTARAANILLDQAVGALRSEIERIAATMEAGNETEARAQLSLLLSRTTIGRRLVAPFCVTLIGPPNVGKSSLINALVGYGRTIVHHEPGTTRDIVTATAVFAGCLLELSDTAGIRTTRDALEAAGIDRSTRQSKEADLVVIVFDRSRPWTGECSKFVAGRPRSLIVYNKADLPSPPDDDRPAGLLTSATTGAGIDGLIAAMIARPELATPPAGTAVPFTERQIGLLERAATASRVEAGPILRQI